MSYRQSPISKSHKSNFVRERDEWDFMMDPAHFKQMLRFIKKQPLRRMKKEFQRRDYMLMVLMGNLGLRISEVVVLQKKHFDLLRRKYPVAKVPTAKQRARDATKPVYVHPKVAEAIHKYFLEYVYKNQKYLFPGGSGDGHVSDRWVRDIFYHYVRECEFEEAYTPHSLRHMFISVIYNRTDDKVFVRDQARHSKASMGLGSTGRYIHELNPEKRFKLVLKTGYFL